jgi:hypothetical protein
MGLLQIKHIILKERYGEGEIPHQSRTGTGPVLLRSSFPYVRDWLNEHPLKNEDIQEKLKDQIESLSENARTKRIRNINFL